MVLLRGTMRALKLEAEAWSERDRITLGYVVCLGEA